MNEGSTSGSSTTIVDHDTVNVVAGNWANRIRRVSWGAILAGFITAAALQLLLSILGLAFGLWSVNPTTEANPVAGLATGTGIYWVLTGIISLFIGGCVAGYMCGVPEKWDGALHGTVIWGLLTIFSFWYVGSTFGTVLSATTSALGDGLATVADWTVPDNLGTSNGQSNQASNQNGQQTFATPNINFEQMGNQLTELLNETGKEDLQPEDLKKSGQRILEISQDAAQTVAKKPESADQQVDRLMGAFMEEWRQVKDDLDQDAATSVIADNSEMSEQEAAKVVNRWESQYDEAKAAADEAQAELAQELEQWEQAAVEQYQDIKHVTLKTTETALDSIATAAMWTFFAMLLGLVSAVAGGAVGAHKMPLFIGAKSS